MHDMALTRASTEDAARCPRPSDPLGRASDDDAPARMQHRRCLSTALRPWIESPVRACREGSRRRRSPEPAIRPCSIGWQGGVEPSPLGRPRGCGGVRGHRGGVRRRSTERLVIRHRAESGPLAHRETTLDSRLELFAQHPGCFVAAVDELEPWMSNSTRQAQRSPTDARLGMRSTAPRKDNLSCGFRGRRARASRGRPTKN